MENELTISDIRHLMPGIIYLKLQSLNVSTARDIINLDVNEFSKPKGTGKKAIWEFQKFQEWLNININNIDLNIHNGTQPIINFSISDELANVEFNEISSLISSKLINKFFKHNIFRVKDLTTISKEYFNHLESVGKGTASILDDLINDLSNDPNKYTKLYKEMTEGVTIPKNLNASEDILNNFKNIITDYIKILQITKPVYSETITRHYFKSTSLEDIGLYFSLVRERIRQIKERTLLDIKSIINEGKSSLINVRCAFLYRTSIIHFIEDLHIIKSASQSKLFDFVKEKYNIILEADYQPFLNLLFDTYNFGQSGQAEKQFTDDTIYIFDSNIDKKEFFNLSKIIFDILKANVSPLEEFNLIIKVKKKTKTASKEFIRLIINTYKEIEIIGTKNSESISYQIKFRNLVSLSGMTERILFEKNQSMHIDDIMREINQRLYLVNVNKVVTKTTLASHLKLNENIVFKGKTGVYSIASWGENEEALTTIIGKSFLHFNKPLSIPEIITFVKSIRPNINKKSIRTIINMNYKRLNSKLYIPNNWVSRYKNELASKKDNTSPKIYEVVIDIIKKEPNKFILLSNLTKILKIEYKIPQPTIYATLNNKKYFIKEKNEKGTRIVRLLTESVLIKINQSEIINNEIKEYFASSNYAAVNLSELIKFIHKVTKINRPSIYKAINENIKMYDKKIIGSKVFISFRNNSNDNIGPINISDNWPMIKASLMRELEPIFTDPRQPKYLNSLDAALHTFKSLIDFQTTEDSINGLHEQLLPTLYKFYYSSNDTSDLLNYFKQISTSLDPYLQKILFLVNTPEYYNLKKAKSGLGSFINALDRLDKNQNRYKKHIKDVPVFKFSQHLFYAYNSRNKVTHEAKKWSKQDIVNHTSSTIVIFIYSVLEYFDEIKSHLK